MASKPREQWTSRAGFILAAVGSAVGLGNMWRFPYLTAKHGGAAFVLLYVTIAAAISVPIMLAEFVIGRGSGKSPVAALRHFGGDRWRPLGWLFVATGFLIVAYYTVISGWTLRYMLEGLWRGFGGDTRAHFEQVATGWDAVGWQVALATINVAIIAGGVKAGIERMSVVLMPLLFALVAALAVYAAFLPGGGEGYRYYLQTSSTKALTLSVLLDAAGQAFFSLSLGMGAMLTYASYLSKEENLPRSALIVAGADFAVALVAGLVVFPMIFAFGLQADVNDSTTGALFITLPRAFASMGGTGHVVGVLFFAVLLVGALTSAMSLLEVVVSTAIDGLGWSRRRAVLVLGLATTALGVPAALDLSVLDVMDKLAGNVMLLIGGLGLAIFTGWVMHNPVAEARRGAEAVRWWPAWMFLLRYVVPAVLAVLVWTSIRQLLGW